MTRHASRPDGARPHLLTMAIGALDARVNHIDYFDTTGGEEVLRWYRQRRAQRPRRTHLRKGRT
jgi:hypothetical protein